MQNQYQKQNANKNYTNLPFIKSSSKNKDTEDKNGNSINNNNNNLLYI